MRHVSRRRLYRQGSTEPSQEEKREGTDNLSPLLEALRARPPLRTRIGIRSSIRTGRAYCKTSQKKGHGEALFAFKLPS